MAATVAVTGPKHVKAKVCLVGDVAVGKTSLIKRFVLDDFDDRYIATVGTKVTKKTVDVTWKGVPATLDLMVWDIMGEKGFRALLRDAYFEGSQGVIAVCDLTRKDTFYDLNNWVQMIRKQLGAVPVVFLGNKMDLTERLVVTQEELARMGTIHSAPHFLASAKTGAGVNEAFKALAEAIGHRGEA
ncbi:MAG TPA: Rab family GTPase [Thermoplasmata archaeon]|jgi:small GTP-binding protein|nr:Rab family GTPase [Thermoplasmata archaeon]